MRKPVFRLLVALVMALVVPIQGITAVTAGICMALGHHGTPVELHTHDGDAVHDHGDGAADEHGAQHAHCPPCASCCAVSAIASIPSIVVPDPTPSGPMSALPASFSGLPPDNLDRPPLAL